MKHPPVQKHQVVELEILDLAFGGLGIAKIGGYVVFVAGAIPGDRVKARITRRQANHAQAEIAELLDASPDRISPDCALHDICGGCTWQNLPYEKQLEYKQRHVAEALKHIGRQESLPMEPVAASPQRFRYRNKMEYTFGANEQGETILGFHVPGRFDKIFEVGQCLIQPEVFDAVLPAVQQWARETGLPPYNPRNRQGILRTIILRHSETTGHWLACILTKTVKTGGHLESLAKVLEQCGGGFAGLLWGYNDGLADVSRMDSEAGRVGNSVLEERLEDFRFRVSPFSFFQVNTPGAIELYRIVREYVELNGRETLLDAYCGTGSIGIFCSRGAKRIYSVELVREAIWDARANAASNGVANCTFIAAPMTEGLALVRAAGAQSLDRIIIDPPRGGMDKRSLRHLLAADAPVFVYVSCNPATLSRDVVMITEAGYRITRLRPVDLFPHTPHIETVIRFERA